MKNITEFQSVVAGEHFSYFNKSVLKTYIKMHTSPPVSTPFT